MKEHFERVLSGEDVEVAQKIWDLLVKRRRVPVRNLTEELGVESAAAVSRALGGLGDWTHKSKPGLGWVETRVIDGFKQITFTQRGMVVASHEI